MAVALLLLMVCACTTQTPQAGRERSADERSQKLITVASFDFPESRVLAEIYAQHLNRHGLQTQRALGLASREVLEPALQEGLVDLVVEYQGSALEFLSMGAGQASADPTTTHRRLVRAFARRGVTALDFAPAQNRNGVVVRADTARRYNLETISDLQPIAPRLVFGGPPECPERPYCLRGLRHVYKLSFRAFRPLDTSGPLTVAALEGGEIDVAMLFTSNSTATGRDFVYLNDDRALQPSENIVPVVRDEVVTAHGERFVEAVDVVTKRLSTDDLIAFDRQAQTAGADPAEIARRWLRQRSQQG